MSGYLLNKASKNRATLLTHHAMQSDRSRASQKLSEVIFRRT